MDDADKIYWLKIIMGISCGILSMVIIPQEWTNMGVRVGLYRLLWMVVSWLLLPFPVVMLGLRFGLVGVTKKDITKREDIIRRGEEVPKFRMKEALKKIGGGKFILKTGVGAFFFLFMLTSTILFTLIYPGI
ncbi:MAG: hypothetical protein ACFFCS_07635 [Candidatus Hodarchaeota archaeon]